MDSTRSCGNGDVGDVGDVGGDSDSILLGQFTYIYIFIIPII